MYSDFRTSGGDEACWHRDEWCQTASCARLNVSVHAGVFTDREQPSYLIGRNNSTRQRWRKLAAFKPKWMDIAEEHAMRPKRERRTSKSDCGAAEGSQTAICSEAGARSAASSCVIVFWDRSTRLRQVQLSKLCRRATSQRSNFTKPLAVSIVSQHCLALYITNSPCGYTKFLSPVQHG